MIATDRHSTERPQISVMLVEDDQDSRDMYAMGLELSGFRVTGLRDGRAAYAQVAAVAPNIIVTDLQLPGMDGLELCRKLKAGEATSDIPVIAVTGRSGARDLDLARAAGFDCILIKPCPPDELRDAIQQVLAHSGELRARSRAITDRADTLRKKSSGLLLQTRVVQCRQAVAAGQEASVPCPTCAGPLTWGDSQAINGTKFDYFRPCAKGCGEFCFDHRRRRFMKLR